MSTDRELLERASKLIATMPFESQTAHTLRLDIDAHLKEPVQDERKALAEEIKTAIAELTDERYPDLIDAINRVAALPKPAAVPSEPVAYIQHHKAGDNLVWDDPGEKCTPLYKAAQLNGDKT
jgi:hypothetical protein